MVLLLVLQVKRGCDSHDQTILYSVHNVKRVIVIVMTKLPPASKQTTSNCNRLFELQFLASVGPDVSTRKLI